MAINLLDRFCFDISARAFLLETFSVLVLVLTFYSIGAIYRQRDLPPGPIGLPFIGNKHQIPTIKPWRKFQLLNQKYGPVVSLFIGKTPTIILGTAQAAWDLLEKRSDIYSSRPRFVVAGEILSDNMRGLMLPNNESWRKWRKILHNGFHARQAAKYKEIQSLESKIAMMQIIDDPDNYEKHLQRYAASVVVSVTYGRRIESVEEWIVRENMESMDYLTSVNIPGKYLVETWPWLLRLPRALQWFRREPEAQKQRDIKLLMHLVADVRQRMGAGTIPDCLTVQALENQGKEGMSDLFLAYSVSSPFGAGIETTAGTLCVFILAMLHFPGVMKKAQAELDVAVPPDRMPEYNDYESLPYVRAIVNETLRWRPVAVLGGTPHAVIADDEYNGMFIPGGSTIFANMYGIMKDPEMFPDPEIFRPERFLETKEPRLTSFELPFGFGRRICPGMHLARNSIFINAARLLWAFDILPTTNNGKEVLPDPMNFTNGFNSRPASFGCLFRPRSEKVISLIRSEYHSAQERLGGWTW